MQQSDCWGLLELLQRTCKFCTTLRLIYFPRLKNKFIISLQYKATVFLTFVYQPTHCLINSGATHQGIFNVIGSTAAP
jgi:hypothetical protein